MRKFTKQAGRRESLNVLLIDPCKQTTTCRSENWMRLESVKPECSSPQRHLHRSRSDRASSTFLGEKFRIKCVALRLFRSPLEAENAIGLEERAFDTADGHLHPLAILPRKRNGRLQNTILVNSFNSDSHGTLSPALRMTLSYRATAGPHASASDKGLPSQM